MLLIIDWCISTMHTAGDQESLNLLEAGKHLNFAYIKWEDIDTRRNFINNELHKVEGLVWAAKQHLNEITALTDLLYISLKQEYDNILQSYKVLLENFKLITEKLKNAEIEYSIAKNNFEAAEIVCDRIAAHNTDA